MSEALSSCFCIQCGDSAHAARGIREVIIGRRTMEIEDEYMLCGSCGEIFYTRGQAAERERRAEAKVRAEGGILPHEVRRLRRRLGYTQEQFESLLGCGAKTVTRWERGLVVPDSTTAILLRLIEAGFVVAPMIQAVRDKGPILPSIDSAHEWVDFVADALVAETEKDASVVNSQSYLSLAA